MNKSQLAVQEALTWLGTPYHHQGRVKGIGTDCGMIILEVFHKLGLIPYVDPRPYPPDWHLHQMEQRYLYWVEQFFYKVDEPQPGDIVLYHFGKCISHAGIITEWPMMVHAYLKQGVILSDGTKGSLARRIVGFYRIKGL